MKGKRKRGEGNLFYCFAMLNCFVCFTRTRRCGCWWATSCASWLSEKGPRPRSPSRSARDSPPLSLSLSLNQKPIAFHSDQLYQSKTPKNQIHLPLSYFLVYINHSLSLSVCVYTYIYREAIYIYIWFFVVGK